MLEYVIFAIDNGDDLHTQAKFLRHVDTLRASEKMVGTMHSGIGSYGGMLERCYMVLALDFDKHFKNLDYLSGQESVLRVPGDTHQPCTLHYANREPQSVGTMRQLKGVGVPNADFTYMNGQYWVCEQETT